MALLPAAIQPNCGGIGLSDNGGFVEQNKFKSSNSDPPPVLGLVTWHVLLLAVIVVRNGVVDDGATLASHEEEEESIFILSFRLAITSSCSRSNNNVCACDAGIFLQ